MNNLIMAQQKRGSKEILNVATMSKKKSTICSKKLYKTKRVIKYKTIKIKAYNKKNNCSHKIFEEI